MIDHVKRSEFQAHCKANGETDEKLNQLMPLVELIPMLKEIVEEKKSMTFVGKRVLKIIGYTATVIGLIIGILELYKRIR